MFKKPNSADWTSHYRSFSLSILLRGIWLLLFDFTMWPLFFTTKQNCPLALGGGGVTISLPLHLKRSRKHRRERINKPKQNNKLQPDNPCQPWNDHTPTRAWSDLYYILILIFVIMRIHYYQYCYTNAKAWSEPGYPIYGFSATP